MKNKFSQWSSTHKQKSFSTLQSFICAISFSFALFMTLTEPAFAYEKIINEKPPRPTPWIINEIGRAHV